MTRGEVVSRSSPLDGLRGVSAQAVFVAHLLPFTVPAYGTGRIAAVLGALAQLAVVTFFVLSGYVIATSLVRRAADGRFNLLEFGIRRLARIWPPFIASLLLIAALVVAIQAGAELRSFGTVVRLPEQSAFAWLRAIGLYSSAGHDIVAVFNSPVWSLRLEVRLYVIAGIAMVAWVAGGLVRWLAVAVAAYLVLQLARLAYGLPSLAIFAAGALAAVAGHGGQAPPEPLSRLTAAVAPLLFIAILGAAAFELPGRRPADIALHVVYGAVLAAALPRLARPLPASSGRLARGLCATGDYSYTLYILHLPLLIALGAGLGLAGHGGLALALFAVNTICLMVAAVAERTDVFTALLRRLVPGRLHDWLTFPTPGRPAVAADRPRPTAS
jgi:peptidoglycan/LPS O-acetylase OafA/YrhL